MKNDTSSYANIPALYKPASNAKLGKTGNIPASAYKLGVENGEIIPLDININGQITTIEIGIEHPALAIGHDISDSSLIRDYIRSALYDQMSALQFWLKLIPSPESMSNFLIKKEHFWSFSGLFPDGDNTVDVFYKLADNDYNALSLRVTSLPREASSLLTVSNRNAISTVLPCTFECLPSNNEVDLQLRTKINEFLKIQPSLFALTLLTTSLDSKSDFETTFATIQRNYNIDISVESIITLLPTLDKYCQQLAPICEPLEVISAFDNLDTNIEFLREGLNRALSSERQLMSDSSFAFSLYHYGIPINDFLMKSDDSMIPLVGNGFIHKMNRNKQNELEWLILNLLPEMGNGDTSFNLKNFISLSPRLISSYTIQPTHLGAIVPAPNLYSIIQNEDLIHSKSLELNLLSKAPITIDSHEVTLSSDPVFEGDLSCLPNFDEDFFDNLKSDFLEGGGVRISGVQHKALLNLTKKDDRNILRLSRGNIPSTHISKFPMLGSIDHLAVAEWLGLTLSRAGGLNVSKFQLVNSEWSNDELEQNDLLYRSDRVLEGANEFFNFKDIDQVKASMPEFSRETHSDRHPPFIVIERFDISYEHQNSSHQFVSRDFCTLAQLPSKKKYQYSMEGVARLIEQYIKNEEDLRAAREHLLRLITASMCVSNNDLHLKNITLLEVYEDGNLLKSGLSPVYDVLVAPMVSPIIRNNPYTQALTIKGTRRPSLSQLSEFGIEHLNFTKKESMDIVKDTISGIKEETIRLSRQTNILGDDPFLVHSLELGLSLVKENLLSLMTHGVEHAPSLKVAATPPTP